MRNRIRNILIISGIILFIFIIINGNTEEKEIKKVPLKTSTYYFTYYLSNTNQSFSDFEKEKIADAFKIINNATNNHFIFSKTNDLDKADFIFYSVEINSEEIGESYLLGEEYYPFYKNKPDTITMGKSYLSDPYPRTEMHEIFHGLGLEHSDNTNSIMYEYLTYARLENDPETISKLYSEWDIRD